LIVEFPAVFTLTVIGVEAHLRRGERSVYAMAGTEVARTRIVAMARAMVFLFIMSSSYWRSNF
jgi:hypothetical protein